MAVLGSQKAYCPKPRDGCGAGLVDGRIVVWSYVSCFYVIVLLSYIFTFLTLVQGVECFFVFGLFFLS